MALRNVIESKYFKDLAASESKDLPKCLDWYPDRLGWQLGLTRKEIRREESYFKLHNFSKYYTFYFLKTKILRLTHFSDIRDRIWQHQSPRDCLHDPPACPRG